VWKSLKKHISEVFIGSVDDMRRFIKEEIPQSIQNHEFFNLKPIVGQPLHCGAERLGLINSS
jgi:transposase